MSDLHKALHDITSIRRDLARSTQFRGYGPATLAATGIFAIIAAVIQAKWIPDPISHHPLPYLRIWASLAAISATLTGVQVVTRTRRVHSGLSNEMLRQAIEQFLPALAAGILLTLVLLRHYSPETFWMLPGLWQIVFSLGVFASCRFLPRPMLAAGTWYLACGLATLSFGNARALSPWTMGLAFGGGQLITATILYLTAQEAEDDATEI
jgi:hypothetical protein